MFRTIVDISHAAQFNMAADAYLLQYAAQTGIMCVRFYFWEPAAVSLGYMQDPSEVLDLEALREQNIEWVRRPTGGRAVLHQEDLTYCCAFPAHAYTTLGSSISESYRIISQCLRKGLTAAGVLTESHDSALDPRAVRSHPRTVRQADTPCAVNLAARKAYPTV